MNPFFVVWGIFFSLALSSCAKDDLPPVRGSIQQISWKSELAADPADLSPQKRQLLPMVQFALKSGPDELDLFKAGGGIAATALGLPADKAELLAKELSAYSKSLKGNSVFKTAPSALRYCYSVSKPTKGLATVYVPEKIGPKTRRIVFVHGYGGSALPLLAPIIQSFSDSVVIAPAFGISGSGISTEYISEAIEGAEETKELAPVRFEDPPLLVALSAGGSAGFRIFSEAKSDYAGFICLAAFPKSKSPTAGSPIRILCGATEPFVKDGTLHRSTRHLRNSDFEIQTIARADHFFLLTHRETTSKILRDWANDIFTRKNP